MNNSPDQKKKIEIFHRINKLKLKAGAPLDDERLGFIDPAAIKRAQGAIDKKEDQYGQEMEEVLVKLDSTWSDLKTLKDKKKMKKGINDLRNFANNIKDLADTYKYALMEHFGKSLRDFCEQLDMAKEEHHTIVQAHIDVMWVAYHQNIKDDGGAAAKELKKIVAKAIEQHG